MRPTYSRRSSADGWSRDCARGPLTLSSPARWPDRPHWSLLDRRASTRVISLLREHPAVLRALGLALDLDSRGRKGPQDGGRKASSTSTPRRSSHARSPERTTRAWTASQVAQRKTAPGAWR